MTSIINYTFTDSNETVETSPDFSNKFMTWRFRKLRLFNLTGSPNYGLALSCRQNGVNSVYYNLKVVVKLSVNQEPVLEKEFTFRDASHYIEIAEIQPTDSISAEIIIIDIEKDNWFTDYQLMQHTTESSDIIIKQEDETFYCHSQMLRLKSPVLRRLLDGETFDFVQFIKSEEEMELSENTEVEKKLGTIQFNFKKRDNKYSFLSFLNALNILYGNRYVIKDEHVSDILFFGESLESLRIIETGVDYLLESSKLPILNRILLLWKYDKGLSKFAIWSKAENENKMELYNKMIQQKEYNDLNDDIKETICEYASRLSQLQVLPSTWELMDLKENCTNVESTEIAEIAENTENTEIPANLESSSSSE